MFSIEGHTVFALMITIEGKEPELWGVYSNAMACCRNGKKVCDAFGILGIEAWYRCKPYDVKDE